MKSKVYFTDFRTSQGNGIYDKLDRIFEESGLADMDFEGKFTAIKLHFGERGNLAFLRHQYCSKLVDFIKARGGKPFLTDCNTLYTGSRTNALDHLDTATENGFNPLTCHANVIIADGLKGNDEVEVPVEGAVYCPTAKIGKAIAEADIIISLTHFKGHESTGFGGTFKNLGMGCGSRAGKKDQHSGGKPMVHEEKCISCKKCVTVCAHDAQDFSTGKCFIDQNKCVGCSRCIEVCPTGAIYKTGDEDFSILNRKIAEYTKAVIAGKPNFHISVVMDISPYCDCYGYNDAPIVPDVGIFASSDPVALDQACADEVNKMPIIENSRLGEMPHTHHDHFTDSHPNTNWREGIAWGEKLGLGSKDYELIKLK